MRIDPVDQFQVEFFKQVLEMIKQLNHPLIQQAQKVNQTKKPLKNQNGSFSMHKKGLVESTEKAQTLIMFSVVFYESSENGQTGHKTIREKMSYVSRGGFKLKKV